MTGFLEMKRFAGIVSNIAVVPNPGGSYPAQRLIVGLVANIVSIRNSVFDIWSDIVSVVERV